MLQDRYRGAGPFGRRNLGGVAAADHIRVAEASKTHHYKSFERYLVRRTFTVGASELQVDGQLFRR